MQTHVFGNDCRRQKQLLQTTATIQWGERRKLQKLNLSHFWMGRPNWVRPGALVDDGRNVTQADLSWCMEEVTQPSLIHSPQTPQFMHSRLRAHSLRLLSEGKRIPKHALTLTHRVQECSCRR